MTDLTDLTRRWAAANLAERRHSEHCTLWLRDQRCGVCTDLVAAQNVAADRVHRARLAQAAERQTVGAR